MSLSIVSKLTIKTLKAQPARHSVESEQMIATIYGRCTDKKAGTSDHGDFIRFKGEFEGVNVKTGEVFRSGDLIVPKTLESLLDSAISLEGNNAVDFAVEVWVEPNEKSITGYSYAIKPLIKPAESDVLAGLRELAAPSVQKALEAPKPEATEKGKK